MSIKDIQFLKPKSLRLRVEADFKSFPGDFIIFFPVALVKGRDIGDGLFPGAVGQGVIGDSTGKRFARFGDPDDVAVGIVGFFSEIIPFRPGKTDTRKALGVGENYAAVLIVPSV